MTVISDTTCLSALTRIGALHLLRSLFGKVTIPLKVYEELLALISDFPPLCTISCLTWQLSEASVFTFSGVKSTNKLHLLPKRSTQPTP